MNCTLFLYFHIGKILFYKIHILHLEAFPVQMGQAAGIGGKLKSELIGVKGLIIAIKPLIQLSVFPVPQQGVTRMGELSADLMGPSGDQLTFHQ